MVDAKKSEQFKRAASNLGIDPEEEDLFISTKYVPDAQWDSERWNGLSQEEAMEQMPGDVVMELGEEIASQSWRNGSWSNVYEYNGKYYSLDEVDMVEFDYPQDAFKRANIGRNDFDEIDSQYIDSKYKHLV